MVLRFSLLGLLLAALPGPALAGDIQGTVTVSIDGEEQSAPRRPAVAELGAHEAAPTERSDRRRCVVYLETAPQPALDAPPAMRAVLDQRNETFLPYVLAVTVGSTVDFPNSDRTYHNVFSLSKARRFDLGRYPRGASRSVRFDKAGVVRVFCEIHSHMNAWILVFSHRYFATTDALGRYRIEGVPPGSYALAVWNDGRVRARRELQLSPGETAQADFVVER